jgi:hypothetical protein
MLGEMKVEQKLNGASGDHRCITGEDDYVVISGQSFLRDPERVSGPALLGLYDEFNACGLHSFSHALGFVADDRIDVFRGNDLRGGSAHVRQ